jgi:hypothetical protein
LILAAVSLTFLTVGRSVVQGQAVLDQQLDCRFYLAHLGLALWVALAGDRHVRGGDSVAAFAYERVKDYCSEQVQPRGAAVVL